MPPTLKKKKKKKKKKTKTSTIGLIGLRFKNVRFHESQPTKGIIQPFSDTNSPSELIFHANATLAGRVSSIKWVSLIFTSKGSKGSQFGFISNNFKFYFIDLLITHIHIQAST